MSARPIPDPLPGERLLAVTPPPGAAVAPGWLGRLHYFPGRTLGHLDLRREQRARAAHLALLGEALSPGVVSGLEAQAETTPEGVLLEIGAGLGLTAGGEAVQLGRSRRLPLDAVPVLTAGMPRLGEARSEGRVLPRLLVLVLQPVAVEHFSDAGDSPCERDPEAEAFENWQWLDGVRLALHPWEEAPPLPAGDDARLRNRAVHALFEFERGLPAGERPPWWSAGLPIALLGLDEALQFRFLDRASVVRRGGEARAGRLPLPGAGDRFLWQARLEQFDEALADWLSAEGAPGIASLEAAERFRHLPPVGVLPHPGVRRAGGARPHWQPRLEAFFPPGFQVSVVPAPLEQLDLAVAESIALQPFDLDLPERLELLLPVPQAHYRPDLLEIAEVPPELQTAVDTHAARRDRWLGRREHLRERASALHRALRGEPLTFPLPDPGALDETETPAPFEVNLLAAPGAGCRVLAESPPADWYQPEFDDSGWSPCPAPRAAAAPGPAWHRHRFRVADLPPARRYTLVLGAAPAGELSAWLNGRPLKLKAADTGGRRFELGELRGLLRAGDNLLAVAGVASRRADAVALLDTEDAYGTEAAEKGGLQVRELAALRRHLEQSTPLRDAEVARLERLGLEGFIAYLKRKISLGDDQVDFGFLRLRTDMYRLRQMMLGNDAATRLATSPALAEIAKGESAFATRKELQAFMQRVRLEQAAAEKGGDGSGTGGDGGASTPTRVGSGTGGLRLSASSKPTRFVRGDAFVAPELAGGGGIAGTSPVSDAVRKEIGLGVVTRDLGLEKAVGAGILGGRQGFALDAGSRFFAAASEDEVIQQSPVVGRVPQFRNVTVAERFAMGSAQMAFEDGLAAKGETLRNLVDPAVNLDPEDAPEAQGLALDDLQVPGVFRLDADNNPTDELVTFGELRQNPELIGTVSDGVQDAPEKEDETGFFNAGVKALENTVGILRLVEGRTALYRRIVARCERARKAVAGELERAERRLRVVGEELAEARHDLAVARALLGEERARVEALNAERRRILEERVPFLLFRRPRHLDARRPLPQRALAPLRARPGLPDCGEEALPPPEPLAALLELLRDAPLDWLRAGRPLLARLDRPLELQTTLLAARRRAAAPVKPSALDRLRGESKSDRLLQALGATLAQAGERVQQQRRHTAGVEMDGLLRLGWAEALQRLPGLLSLGDLADALHGRPDAGRAAGAELERIAQVATCLYRDFSRVPATLRLHWAELLGQFDGPVQLRSLSALPRFDELDPARRRALQEKVDWLFGRFREDSAEALAFASDLVRVALLVASHAPVDRLLEGRLLAPATLQPGGRVRVQTDLTRVRIGMQVNLARGGETLALGRVSDILAGEVVAELTTVQRSARLEAGVPVQILQTIPAASRARVE